MVDIDMVAEALWRHEAEHASPVSHKARQHQKWVDQADDVMDKWRGYAGVAIAAMRKQVSEVEDARADSVLDDLRRRGYRYPIGPLRAVESFTDDEKVKLRPIAETLAMLDGNAFFTAKSDGREHYEFYLPDSAEIYESNGGDAGWAGEASFAKASLKRIK